MTTENIHSMPVDRPAGPVRGGQSWIEPPLVLVNAALAVIMVYGMLSWDSGVAIWLAPGAFLRILAAFGMGQGWRGRWCFQVACGLWLVLLGCLFLLAPDPGGGG
jgi:hypothetical protein